MTEALEFTHPELRRRYENLVERMWERGWQIYVIASTRSADYQRWLYAEFKAGRYPYIVADPDRVYGVAPTEIGGWVARGSMHMAQADGWSHALDIGWRGPRPDQVHQLAHTLGLRFPEPTENWHMEWWSPGLGVYPILDPTAEADYVSKEEFASWIGATIAPAGHPHAGKVCVPLVDHVVRDTAGNIVEVVKELWPLGQGIEFTHQELKLARLQQPGNTELS